MFLYKCIDSFKYNYLINQLFTNSISILALFMNGSLLHCIQHIFYVEYFLGKPHLTKVLVTNVIIVCFRRLIMLCSRRQRFLAAVAIVAQNSTQQYTK